MLTVIQELQQQGKLTATQQLLLAKIKPTEELYDVIADSHEINNLADSADHQATLDPLRILLDQWIADTDDHGLRQKPITARTNFFS